MTTSTQTKGMCIATRCTSVEQFIQMFHRFVDEESFFVSTHNTRPAGLETAFSVQLADGTPVLRGHCVVLQSWANANSPFKTPGVRLGIQRLTASSMHVFEQLLVTRTPTSPLADDVKTKLAQAKLPPADAKQEAKPEEQRTPGSELILPANPLSGIHDVALEGFVDCTLYEETGNFFPVEDEITPAPVRLKNGTLPPPISPTPVAIVNAPMEMSVLAPLPAQPASMPTGTTMPPPLPGPATIPPFAPFPQRSAVTTPPPLPIPSLVQPPPIPMIAMPPAPPAREPEVMVPTRTSRVTIENLIRKLPPRRYLLAAGFTVVGIATVAIAASRGDSTKKPAAPKSEPMKVAQLETPKSVVEAPEPPPPPPAPAPVEAADDEVTSDGPAVIGEGPCKLEVATTPAGSMISLDDKVLAPSPLTLATTCEKHKLEIAHARYVTTTKFVALAKPEDKLEVNLMRPTHTVSITSTPSGATIFIDGHRAGTTPTTLSVIGFQQVTLEVKKSGYQTQTTKLYSKVPKDKVALKLSRW